MDSGAIWSHAALWAFGTFIVFALFVGPLALRKSKNPPSIPVQVVGPMALFALPAFLVNLGVNSLTHSYVWATVSGIATLITTNLLLGCLFLTIGGGFKTKA